MATFWERSLFGQLNVFFVLCLHVFVILVVSHFGFKSGTVVLTASVPGHCLLL